MRGQSKAFVTGCWKRPIFRFPRRNRTFCPFTYAIFYHKKEEERL